jgi:hypothetical protein
MYRQGLRVAAAICLMSTFWSGIRVFDISIFEWLALLVIPCVWIHRPKEEGVPLASFKLAGCGLALLAFAGIISSQSSFDPNEHVLKVVKLIGAFALMIGLAYVLANRKIFNIVEALYLLCLSAAACSLVAILQGQLGILTGLIPRSGAVEDWTRMTGLAEHPIETGIIAAYGIAIGLGLGLHIRKWRMLFFLIAIDVYSMRYSASLTAVFAFLIASVVLCLHAKAYKLLFLGGATGALVTAAVMAVSPGDSGLLQSRLMSLYESQGNYQTVQSRQMQLRKAIDLIAPDTLAVGNGYSSSDLPYKMEIHNGLVASVFHFGLLGLVSQCFLVGFFVAKLRGDAPRPLKRILLGCIVVFILPYLSGPPQARPSLWAPVILLGAYLAIPKKDRFSSRPAPNFKPIIGPSDGIKQGNSRLSQTP